MAADSRKAANELTAMLNDDVNVAIERVLSKSESCESVPKDKRLVIVEQLAMLVFDEVKQRYTESDDEVPYEDAKILNESLRLLKPIVMKIPFNPTGGAAAAAASAANDVDDE
jgi:hypothetical protein